MPAVSVNILTKNRADMLFCALRSVTAQSFTDYEIVLVNDGSQDHTDEVVQDCIRRGMPITGITHEHSRGIAASRQAALLLSRGRYIAPLDDDDEWSDPLKLTKQVSHLDTNPEVVLVGGAMSVGCGAFGSSAVLRRRPQSDARIRASMLLRNNFFTSSVMFRKAAAVSAGGFIDDGVDVAEDYDLWLRLGTKGRFFNFQDSFVNYRLPHYGPRQKLRFLRKQLALARRSRGTYPYCTVAVGLLSARITVLSLPVWYQFSPV